MDASGHSFLGNWLRKRTISGGLHKGRKIPTMDIQESEELENSLFLTEVPTFFRGDVSNILFPERNN